MSKALEMKQKYKGKEYNGYKWFYYDADTKHHHFQKEISPGKFVELVCLTIMFENGDFEYMADHGLTLGCV